MDGDVTLELYARSLAPRGDGGRLEAALEELSRLASADSVAGYEVTVWGDAVRTDGPASRTRPGAETLATVEQFTAWAEAEGADFPASEATRGTIADEVRAVLELPPLALAEYRDGALARVTPHVREGRVTTVEDHLDSLLARTRRDAGPADGESAGDGEVLAEPR